MMKQNEKKVVIADELVRAWENLWQTGDYTAIGAVCGVPHNYISRVFKTKKAPTSMYEAIKNFYSERAKDLHQQKAFAKSLNAA